MPSLPAESPALGAALQYAAHGWPVFPLVRGAKRPLTASGFKDATSDSDKIRAWFTEYPDANIGLPTGAASGITALDVDVKPWKGVLGDETLAALVAEHGALPPTPQQTTWSGGAQYFFEYAPGVRNSVSKLGRGLDIRSDGGYVVVPPSTVTEDGRSGYYAWHTFLDPFAMLPAPMPDWLLARVKSASQPKAASRSAAPSADTRIKDGTRNSTLASLAGTMRRRGMSVEAMRQALLIQNAEQCDPPLEDEEVAEIARSIARYAPAAPLMLKLGSDGELTPDENPLSEGGDAERMVFLYGDRFRWVAEEKTWLAWDDRRWARDKMFEVQRMARETVLALQAAGLALTAPAARKRVLNHALRADSAKGVEGMVKLARYLPGVTIPSDALDADREVLNVQNGILDLRTFDLRPHDPQAMLTRLVDVPYEPEAQAPTWLKFLNDVFLSNTEVIEFVQRCVGYTLTGLITEQVVFFLHGAGQNGKSTFVEVLDSLLADYATNAGKETFLASQRNEGRGPEPELMRLAGKRFAYVDEVDEGRAIDEGRIKALTGGETTTARDLYKTTETFRNTAKVWFDLNTLPDFKGVDYGIERRLVVIPFDWKVPDAQKVGGMAMMLKAELPGILAWAVEGCRRWRQSGLANRPAAVTLATRRYRDEQNHLPAFVEEFYMLTRDGRVDVAQLQQDYAGFCAQRGEPQLDYQRKMVRYLRDVLKLTLFRTKNHRVWLGLAPRSAG